MKTIPPPVLCTVLAGAGESVALIDDLGALGYPVGDALHLSRAATREAVERLDAAGLVTIAVRTDATVRALPPGAGGPVGARTRLVPLALMERHNPEAYWALVDERIGAGRMLLLLPLAGPAALERAAFDRCLARGTDRVQLVDIGPA